MTVETLPRDYKYTDTDVRRNLGTATLFAMEYLRDYAGDFEPLVALKRTYEIKSLNVGQVRTVLNCARHDSYAEIPPMYPTHSVGDEGDDSEDNVVVMKERLRKRNKRAPKLEVNRKCDIEGYHDGHGHFGKTPYHPEDPYLRCYGKHEYNRHDFELPLKVNWPFMMGKSRLTVHRVSQDRPSTVLWTPLSRKLGYARAPIMKVRTHCEYPSMLRDPILIKKLVNPFAPPGLDDPKLCVRCFPEYEAYLASRQIQEDEGE